MKEQAEWKELLVAEQGFGTLEMVLIIVVLIALVLIFKNQMTDLVNTIFEQIHQGAAGIYS